MKNIDYSENKNNLENLPEKNIDFRNDEIVVGSICSYGDKANRSIEFLKANPIDKKSKVKLVITESGNEDFGVNFERGNYVINYSKKHPQNNQMIYFTSFACSSLMLVLYQLCFNKDSLMPTNSLNQTKIHNSSSVNVDEANVKENYFFMMPYLSFPVFVMLGYGINFLHKSCLRKQKTKTVIETTNDKNIIDFAKLHYTRNKNNESGIYVDRQTNEILFIQSLTPNEDSFFKEAPSNRKNIVIEIPKLIKPSPTISDYQNVERIVNLYTNQLK